MKFQTILCPTDFSEVSQKAMEYAVHFASFHQAKILLLNVVDHLQGFDHYQILAITPQEIAEKMEKQARKDLNALAKKIKNAVEIEKIVRQGKAFVEIIKTAKERNADLIIMGSHGRSGLPHILIGSVAEKVVRNAPCPVLVYRGKDAHFQMV